MSEDTTKQVITSSDAGGGVGFGIPDDDGSESKKANAHEMIESAMYGVVRALSDELNSSVDAEGTPKKTKRKKTVKAPKMEEVNDMENAYTAPPEVEAQPDPVSAPASPVAPVVAETPKLTGGASLIEKLMQATPDEEELEAQVVVSPSKGTPASLDVVEDITEDQAAKALDAVKPVVKYMVNDFVYSKSLKISGMATDVHLVGNTNWYAFRLTDEFGNVSDDDAIAPEHDLVSKQNQNPDTSNEEEFDSEISNEVPNEIPETPSEVKLDAKGLTQAVSDKLSQAQARFAKTAIYIRYNPASENEDQNGVVGLQEYIAGILDNQEFSDWYKDNNKKRYFRAIQNALGALGAAHNILSASLYTIDSLQEQGNDEEAQQVRQAAQDHAYDRLELACESVISALSVGSPAIKPMSIENVERLVPQKAKVEVPAKSTKPRGSEFVKSFTISNIPQKIDRLVTGMEKIADDMDAGYLPSAAQSEAFIEAVESIKSHFDLPSVPASLKSAYRDFHSNALEIKAITEDYYSTEQDAISYPHDLEVAQELIEISEDLNDVFGSTIEGIYAIQGLLENYNVTA